MLETLGGFSKFIETIKNSPAWLITAFFVAIVLITFVPVINVNLPQTFQPYLVISMVVSGAVASFKWVQVLIDIWRAARTTAKVQKTFHLTPTPQFCHWSVTKQPDGSVVTQLTADFVVKNQSTAPIGLINARIIKPRTNRAVLQNTILVRAQNSSEYGIATFNHRIAVGTALPARVIILILGNFKQDEKRNLEVTLGISDEDGHEQRVRVICKASPQT